MSRPDLPVVGVVWDEIEHPWRGIVVRGFVVELPCGHWAVAPAEPADHPLPLPPAEPGSITRHVSTLGIRPGPASDTCGPQDTSPHAGNAG